MSLFMYLDGKKKKSMKNMLVLHNNIVHINSYRNALVLQETWGSLITCEVNLFNGLKVTLNSTLKMYIYPNMYS